MHVLIIQSQSLAAFIFSFNLVFFGSRLIIVSLLLIPLLEGRLAPFSLNGTLADTRVRMGDQGVGGIALLLVPPLQVVLVGTGQVVHHDLGELLDFLLLF